VILDPRLLLRRPPRRCPHQEQRGDDGDPVFHEVNAKGVNPFADKQTQSDVYDSLAKKGFIQ
jgi:hypothetical protein